MGVLDLFRPKWKHSDFLVREKAVKKLNDNDQLQLAEVAKNDESWPLRKFAVYKLESLEVLEEIALNDEEKYVRLAAVEKIKNKKVLAQIAKFDKEFLVREKAVKLLEDQRILADIAINDEHFSVAWEAAQKITNPNLVVEVIKNDKHGVRVSIIKRLEDQELIAEIAIHDENTNAQIIALDLLEKIPFFPEKIASELAEIARNHKDARVRESAVRKLYDQSLLLEIAMNEEDLKVRETAVYLLKDQELLAKLAQNVNENENIRKAAVWNLMDQSLLADLAINDNNVNVRMIAVEKLEDQVLLTEIAKNDSVERVRATAVTKLQDQELLELLARDKTGRFLVYNAAMNKIEDLSVLLDIANSSESPIQRNNARAHWAIRRAEQEDRMRDFILRADPDIRTLAVGRIKDQILLAELAMNEQSKYIRENIVYKLRDYTLLVDIAMNDDEYEVREAARHLLLKLKATSMI